MSTSIPPLLFSKLFPLPSGTTQIFRRRHNARTSSNDDDDDDTTSSRSSSSSSTTCSNSSSSISSGSDTSSKKKKKPTIRQKTKHNMFGKNALCFLDAEFGACFTLSHNNGTNNCATTFPLLIAPPTNINAVESMNEDGGNCFLSLSTEVIHQKKPTTSNNKNVPQMITTKIIAPHCFLSKPQPQKSHFQNNGATLLEGQHNNNNSINSPSNATSSSGGGSVGASSWKEVTSMETKAFALGSILADKGEEYCDHLDLLQENGIRHYLSGMNDDDDDEDRAHESDTDDTDDDDKEEEEEEEEISEDAEENSNQEVEKGFQMKRNGNRNEKNASSTRKQRRRLLVADNRKEIIQNWISADGSRICCLVKCQVPFYSPLYRFHRDQNKKQTKSCASNSQEQDDESHDENKHHECASIENEQGENDPHFSYLLFFDAFPCKSAGCGWYLSAVCKLPNLFPKHRSDAKHQVRKSSSDNRQGETIFAYSSFTGGFITPNIFVFGWTAHCINISFAQNRFDVTAKIFRYDPPKEEIHVSAPSSSTRSLTPTRKSSSHESHTDVFIRNAAALRTLVAASRRSAHDYAKKNLSLLSSSSPSSSSIENGGNDDEKRQHHDHTNPLFRVTSWWNIAAASAITDRDASQIFIFSLDDVRYLILPQIEHHHHQGPQPSSSTGGVDVHAPIFLHLKISSNKSEINDIISQSVKGLSLLAAESSASTSTTQQHQQNNQNQNTHKPTSVVAAANQKLHSRQIVSQLLLSKIPPTPPSYFLRTQRHSTILDNSVVYESGSTSAFSAAAAAAVAPLPANNNSNNSGLQNNYRNALFDTTAATSSSSNHSFVSSSTSVAFHCGIVPKSSHTPLPLHPTANRRIERIFSSGNWMTANNAEQFFTNCGQSNNNNNGSSSDDTNNSALTAPGSTNQGNNAAGSNNNASTGNVLTNFFTSLASGGSGGSGSNAPSNNVNFFHGSENNNISLINNNNNNNNGGSAATPPMVNATASGAATTMNGGNPTTSPAALLLAQNNEQSPSYSLIWETFLPASSSSTSTTTTNNAADQQSTFASNSSSSSNANNNNNNTSNSSSGSTASPPSSLPAILNCLFPAAFGVRLHLHIAGKKPMVIARENIPSFYSSAVAATVTAPYQVAMTQQHAAIVGDNVVPGIDCLADLFRNGPNRVLNVALVEENRIRIAYLSYHTQPHDLQPRNQKASSSSSSLFDKNQENNNNNNQVDFLTSRSSSSTSSSGFTSASRSGGMLNNALNKHHMSNNRGTNNNAKSSSPISITQRSSFRNNNTNSSNSIIKLNIIEVTFVPTGFFTRNKEVPPVALYSVQLPGSFSVPSFSSCLTNQNAKREENNASKNDLSYLQQVGFAEYFSSLSHAEQQIMNLKNVLSASPSLFYPPPPLGSGSTSNDHSSSFSFLHQWSSSTSCCSVGVLSDGNSLMVSQIPERIQ